MNIRPIAAHDISKLVQLAQAYIEEACPDLVPSQWNAAMMIATPSTNLLSQVAVEDGKIIGFTLLRHIMEVETKVKTAHSMGTYVVPAFRRQGIAEALRREAMARAKAEGFALIQGFARSHKNADPIVKLGGAITGLVVECSLH